MFPVENTDQLAARSLRAGCRDVDREDESLPVAADVPQVAAKRPGKFEEYLWHGGRERRRRVDVNRHHEEIVGVQVLTAEEDFFSVSAPMEHGLHAILRYAPFPFAR